MRDADGQRGAGGPAGPASGDATGRTASGREMAAALGMLAIGGTTALVASGRTWATVDVADPLATQVLTATGRDLAPGVAAGALVALAGLLAVAASQGIVRRLVGAVLAGAGGSVVLAVIGAADPAAWAATRTTIPAPVAAHGTAWPAVAAVAGAVIAFAGAWVAWRGPAWPALGRRYEAAPAAAPPATGQPAEGAATTPAGDDGAVRQAPDHRATWDALDRGEDPTARHGP